MLSTIPSLNRYAFLDLGCGKGRGLVVASELPFRSIMGVEIDPALCRTARRNAATVQARYPDRTPIEVQEADVATFDVPGGDLVVFIYHAFSVALLHQVVARLLDSGDDRSLFVVYEYPEFGHVFDAEPRLRPWFAETVPHEATEFGVGSGSDETAVCWVSRWNLAPSWPGADAIIDTTNGAARLRPL